MPAFEDVISRARSVELKSANAQRHGWAPPGGIQQESGLRNRHTATWWLRPPAKDAEISASESKARGSPNPNPLAAACQLYTPFSSMLATISIAARGAAAGGRGAGVAASKLVRIPESQRRLIMVALLPCISRCTRSPPTPPLDSTHSETTYPISTLRIRSDAPACEQPRPLRSCPPTDARCVVVAVRAASVPQRP